MGYSRKQQDSRKGKVRNLVARDSEHRGGFHGKTVKAQRSNMKNELSKADLYDESEWEMFEQEWGYE